MGAGLPGVMRRLALRTRIAVLLRLASIVFLLKLLPVADIGPCIRLVHCSGVASGLGPATLWKRPLILSRPNSAVLKSKLGSLFPVSCFAGESGRLATIWILILTGALRGPACRFAFDRGYKLIDEQDLGIGAWLMPALPLHA
jgi:hypothetical protein